MNQRVDLLLTLARKSTENEEFSSTEGIDDDLLYQYINDGQYRLLSKITEQHQSVFVKQSPNIDVVIDQEEYTLPDDVFLENRISLVEYSHTGLSRDFIKLDKKNIQERDPNSSGSPSFYIRRSGKVLLQPIPNSSTGAIRVNYQRRVAELSPRIGKVSAVTLNTSTKTITSLTLDVADSTFNHDKLIAQDFICAINVLGDQQMVQIQIDDVNITTGVVTVTSSFVFNTGETISVGDFITGGFSSTTHSELPKVCERYILGYLIWKIMKKDSSEDSTEQSQELQSMERDIVSSFAEPDDDITFVIDLEV